MSTALNKAIDGVRRHQLNVDAYRRMFETGVIAQDARVELIDGEIFDMPPIGLPHSSIVNQLTERFVLAMAGHAIVQPQSSIVLSDLSEPEPDLCVLRTEKDYYRYTPKRTEDVLLIVGVAESSMAYDRSIKVPMYARHNLPEVWLIDVQRRELHRFLEPCPDGYQKHDCLPTPATLTPTCLPEISIDMSGVI